MNEMKNKDIVIKAMIAYRKEHQDILKKLRNDEPINRPEAVFLINAISMKIYHLNEENYNVKPHTEILTELFKIK